MSKIRIILILPSCFLLLNILEEIILFYLRVALEKHHIQPWVFILVLMILFATGFSIAGDWVVPKIKGLLNETHKKIKKQGGTVGELIFWVLLLGGIYIAYYAIYINGLKSILPDP